MLRKLFPLFFIGLLSACWGSRDISTQNLSALYRSTEQVFHPEFTVFHAEDSLSKVFFKMNPDELLFVRQSNDQFKAVLKVYAQLVESYESAVPLDTHTVAYAFEMSEKGAPAIMSFDFPVKHTGDQLLRLTFTDANKNYSEDFFVNFTNAYKHTRQFFFVTDKNLLPMFRNSVSANDAVHIQYRDSAVTTLWCKYYNRNFALAPPPFSFDSREEFNYHPDSVFRLDLSDTTGLVLKKEGFYHFQVDSSEKDGLTLFRFSTGFPVITTPLQMVESARYLTSKREYEEMLSGGSYKSAIENYWLLRTGNAEKARMIIKKYYTRVQEANRYFTSYTEGWRTDRGMLYIVFGSPNSIYRNAQSESWIYGTPNSALSLNFFFTKVINPFTDNDFTLSRSPMYEQPWTRAVEVWRQGRAYNSLN